MKEKLRRLRNQIDRERHAIVLWAIGLPEPYDDICELHDRLMDLCVCCEELADKVEQLEKQINNGKQ